MRQRGIQPDDVEEAVAGHVVRNQALCERIESLGADLTEIREIDLHFWADGELAAHRLAAALEERGWSRIHSWPTEQDGVWSLEVKIERSVLEVVDIAFIQDVVGLAIGNQSEFDGWGTSV